ncbi:Uncharacterised protein [Campylobacter ureolyticus]|uniref:hypothetical protein n=1 Tax=Campylobacter ureolyticus TaxID=827 RepID=UPI000DF10ADE|nr:hypothetical protein [Campylobacter ureolyticus]MCZ6156923.1 hypothetical protein [Campylobacter ureolyticus]STA63155.1 Uncharacterised protein [Campylobacter ureolyticus]
MEFQKIECHLRNELLLQIKTLLLKHNWQVLKDEIDTLWVINSLGDALMFKLIGYRDDPNYGSSDRCSIYISKGLDLSKKDYEQNLSKEMCWFKLGSGKFEFEGGYLFADEKDFIMFLDINSYQKLIFLSSYINKTHDFNGGKVAYSSNWASWYSGYNWASKNSNFLEASYNAPFSDKYGGNLAMELGGKMYFQGPETYKNDLNKRKITTNLYTPDEYNEIASISAIPLLRVGKSHYSGLYTLITPNIFYKNNINKWVHAGELSKIRVFKEVDKFETGQILHLGSEKFIVLRYSKTQDFGNNYYIMAVKIV